MRDANVSTLLESPTRFAPTARRVEVTRDNAIVRVVVDPSCDLLEEFRKRYNVAMLAQVATFGKTDLLDRGDQAERIRAYVGNLVRADLESKVGALSVNDIRDGLASKIEHNWTHAVVIAPATGHSTTFVNAVQASQQVAVVVNRVRKSSVNPFAFHIGVIDSGNIAAGEGVLAFDAVARSHVGLFGDRLIHHLEGMRLLVHNFVVTRDTEYIARDKTHICAQNWNWWSRLMATFGRLPVFYVSGGRSRMIKRVGGYEAAIDHAFAKACDGVAAGLKTPAVCVSYAGDPTELEKFAGFAALKDAARVKKIRVLVTPMSLVEGARLGRHALSVAFASSNYRP
jgi:fatty acid-binding protein DegV